MVDSDKTCIDVLNLVGKMFHNLKHGAANVVDFVQERNVVGVADVAQMFRVSHVTVRRWFKRGLASTKIGGKVITTLEALNRFQTGGQTATVVQAVVVDHDTLAALKSLRSKGIVLGSEARRDGNSNKATVGR